MNTQVIADFIFGLTLVITLLVIIIYYYSKKRRTKVEEPKYKMMDEDD